MSRRREHVIGLVMALLLCAAIVWASVALNRQPQAEAVRTVNLISSGEKSMSTFYSSRFIAEVRSQTGVDSLPDTVLFERTLSFLLSNSTGWPAIRRDESKGLTWDFVVIAPVNIPVRISTERANGYLIFDHAEGLEELMLAKPDLWTEHLGSREDAER